MVRRLIAVALACPAALLAGSGFAAGPAATAGAAASVTGPAARLAGTARPGAALPLAGKVVGIDPGHNGRNYTDPAYLNRLVWNGREWEHCDTTGTQTSGGYAESLFTFRVAGFLRADLRQAGARVVMTRTSNRGVGPCVNRRAQILNSGHANVSVDIHADGGPSWGRGFSILEPVKDRANSKVIGSSVRFGGDVRAALRRYTSMPVSNYYGNNGIVFRGDLAGLNLTTEPKVLVECGNMRNSADARLLTATWFQKRLAKAFTAAIIAFLTRH